MLLAAIQVAFARGIGIEQFNIHTEPVLQDAGFFLHPGPGLRAVRHFQFGVAAGLEIDALVNAEVTHEFDRVHLRSIVRPRLLEADLFDQIAAVQAGAANAAEPTVAARRAPADVTRFEKTGLFV